MNPVALDFELNDDERKQIEELAETARKKLGQNSIKEEKMRYDYRFSSEEKEMLKIHANAHGRALKYYGTHLDELTEALKREIKLNATFIAAMEEGETEKESRLETFLKENLKRDTAPYLEMLKENRPQVYAEIIAFIDYAFEHRAELYKKAREELRKKSGTKINNEKPETQPKGHSVANPALSLMFNGDAITALGLARGKGKFIPETGALKVNGVNMFSPESVLKVGVGTAKIFRYAVAEFTKRNSNKITKEKINLRIFLDIKDFATANEIKTNSESAMKNFKFKLRKNLETLSKAQISWGEKVKGKRTTFSGVNYIGAYDLGDKAIKIEFTLSMAEYLVSLPQIQYPVSLYRLDDRDYNAFAIGEAMCIHYSQDNNVIRQTEGKLRVENLLKYTSFPTYEELKENRWSWEERVKDRFEDCLDRLYQCGFLKEYSYCYSGGIEITDEEMNAGAIDSYEKFISLLVKFELNDFEASEIRAIEIKEKKGKSAKKFQAKQTKYKTTQGS